jgi:hypothetical protein
MRFAACPVSLALLFALLLLTGCGGTAGGKSGSFTIDPPGRKPEDRHAFAAKAEAICAGLNSKLKASKLAGQSEAVVLRVGAVHAKLERTAVSELNALVPPSSLAASWGEMLSMRVALASALEQAVRAVQAQDSNTLRIMNTAKASIHARESKDAHKLGLKRCATIV